MPYTRSSSLTAISQEPSESRDLLQVSDTNSPGWNDYLDWECQPETMALFSGDDIVSDQPMYYTDCILAMTETANGPLDTSITQASSTDFDSLQKWYSSATQVYSSISPPETTRPQLSTSVHPFCDSSAINEESQSLCQTHGTQPRLSELSHHPSSIEDEGHLRRSSDSWSNEVVEELEDPTNPSSSGENERMSTPKFDANKKRRINHSVIEKNYRSRIRDGMAELRHCVPSTLKGRSPREPDRSYSQLAGKSLLKRSSGKVATLSDAVQYLRALELRKTALQSELDNLQRRNSTLQKIALSKIDMSPSATTIGSEKA